MIIGYCHSREQKQVLELNNKKTEVMVVRLNKWIHKSINRSKGSIQILGYFMSSDGRDNTKIPLMKMTFQ